MVSQDDRPLTDAEVLAFMRRLAIQVAREEYEAEKVRLRAGQPRSKPIPMLLPKDVALRWGCSDRTVRNMIEDGRLPGYRIGTKLVRVRLEDVELYERTMKQRAHEEPASPAEPEPKGLDAISRLRLAALRKRARK